MSIPPSTKTPGIQIGRGVDISRVGFSGTAGTLTVPIEVNLPGGAKKHITLTFTGPLKSLNAFKNNTLNFRSTVLRVASAAIRSKNTLQDAPSNSSQLPPITFQAADLSDLDAFARTQEKKFEKSKSWLTSQPNQPHVDYVFRILQEEMKRIEGTVCSEESLREYLEGKRGTLLNSFAGKDLEIAKKIIEHVLDDAVNRNAYQTKKTYGFGKRFLHSLSNNLSVFASGQAITPLKMIVGESFREEVITGLNPNGPIDNQTRAALDAFDKAHGTFYSRNALEAVPHDQDPKGLPDFSQPANVNSANVLAGNTRLNANWERLTQAGADLGRTSNKNERQTDNLLLLSQQYREHASACRNLLQGINPPNHPLAAHYDQQAEQAAMIAFDLQKTTESQLKTIEATIKATAITEGKLPYATSKTLKEVLLNAEAILDPKFFGAPDLTQPLGLVTDIDAFKNYSSTSPTAALPTLSSPRQYDPTMLKGTVDAYKTKLEQTLTALRSRSHTLSPQERGNIPKIEEKLKEMTEASIYLGAIEGYSSQPDNVKGFYIEQYKDQTKAAANKIESLLTVPDMPPAANQQTGYTPTELEAHFNTVSAIQANHNMGRCQIASQQQETLKKFDDLIAQANGSAAGSVTAEAPPSPQQQLVINSLKAKKTELEQKHKEFLKTIDSIDSPEVHGMDITTWQSARQEFIDTLPERTEVECARKYSLRMECSLNVDSPQMPGLPHSTLSAIPEEKDLQLRDQVAHIRAAIDFKKHLPLSTPTPSTGGTGAAAETSAAAASAAAETSATARTEPIAVQQRKTIDDNLMAQMTTLKTGLVNLASSHSSKQHTANLLTLAAMYDEMSNDPTQSNLSLSRDELRSAADACIESVDKALKAVATASLSTPNPQIPYTSAQIYREVMANATVLTEATPPTGMTDVAKFYGNLSFSPPPTLPDKAYLDKLAHLQQDTLTQLRSVRSFSTQAELPEVEAQITPLEKKLGETMTASIQLAYIEAANGKSPKEQAALKKTYDIDIHNNNKRLEAVKNIVTHDFSSEPLPSSLNQTDLISEFARICSLPVNTPLQGIAIANRQKDILDALDGLINQASSTLTSTELADLQKQKTRLEAQYKAHLRTLRTPPRRDITGWQKARRNAILTSPEMDGSRRMRVTSLQIEFYNNTPPIFTTELPEFYTQNEPLPPLPYQKGSPPTLTLDSDPAKRAEQLKEIRADLKDKHQFLGSVTNKDDQVYKDCAELLKAQYEALRNACVAVNTPPPSPLTPVGTATATPSAPSPLQGTSPPASPGSPPQTQGHSPAGSPPATSPDPYLTKINNWINSWINKPIDQMFDAINNPFDVFDE